MTYYNCAKFHCFSIFSFGVSRGGQNDPPLGTNVAKKPLRVNMMKTKPDMNKITYKEEKVALVLGITAVFTVWWMFQ